ncbi:MAG: tRNA lysidine(34) synthetase TilS [Candidatus Marinimicrobia bacterium]|jgi:tRNA(Ile)-lysidine synthase|nr:tRNA lysidine(34) synthetase TilS [Candidatus Neomarinimicrobiota bacterium]
MNNLEEQFKNNSEIRELIPSSSHLIIAISGGMDSVILAHILLNIQHRFNYQLTMAHVNHKLRENADKDMKFVKELSRKWDLSYEMVCLDPQTRRPNESVEAWARKYRYEALEKIRSEVNGDFILTAHHKTDQAETILMRLAQGTGGKGFKGIHRETGRIRRPLLNFTKKELMDYAGKHNLSYVEDETNSDISIPRNFIRHNILSPWILQDHHVEKGIVRTGSHITELVDSAIFTVDYFYKKLVRWDGETEERILLKNEMVSLPLYIQLELLKKCMDLSITQWRRDDWITLKSFLVNSETGDVFSSESGWDILNNRNEWIVFKKERISKVLYEINLDGNTLCGNLIFNWEWVSTPSKVINETRNSEFIDGGKIQNKKLFLRHWKKGDRFQPLGMKGWKKVSDFLIDEKVNLHLKNKQLVLTADEKIVWVCGHRISDWVKVTPETSKPAKISLNLPQ